MCTVTSPSLTGSVAGSMGSTTMLVELDGSALLAVVQPSSKSAALRTLPVAVSPTRTVKLTVLVALAPTESPVQTTRLVALS